MSYSPVSQDRVRSWCVALMGLLMSGISYAPTDADEVSAPVVTLRAELRLPQTNGTAAYRYVPATTVEQGQEINYTVRITNPNAVVLPPTAVMQALPTNTHYVAGSASGAGADIQFSVDGGQSYGKPGSLRSPGNAARIASPAEYTHIRWQLRYPLAPKAVVLARFQAVFD